MDAVTKARYVAMDKRGTRLYVVIDLHSCHREVCVCTDYGDAVAIANALEAAERDPETVEDL